MDYIMCERGNRGRGSRTEWDTSGASRRKWDPYRYYRHGEVGILTRYILAPRTEGLLGFLEYGLTVGDMLIAIGVVAIMRLVICAAWFAFAPIV